MNRYVFRFSKKGYMRFISHLDLQRLFKRSLRRADVEIAFSEGFNPHPRMNIVQPLSLGFYAECDYFEVETKVAYDTQELLRRINAALPVDMIFLECKEFPMGKKNLSSYVEYAEYKALVPLNNEESQELHLNDFLAQASITIMKRDKKTKQLVEKDVKSMIKTMEVIHEFDDGVLLGMVLRSASNETLNPMNLMASLCSFSGLDVKNEALSITRTELYVERDGRLKSIFELY